MSFQLFKKTFYVSNVKVGNVAAFSRDSNYVFVSYTPIFDVTIPIANIFKVINDQLVLYKNYYGEIFPSGNYFLSDSYISDDFTKISLLEQDFDSAARIRIIDLEGNTLASRNITDYNFPSFEFYGGIFSPDNRYIAITYQLLNGSFILKLLDVETLNDVYSVIVPGISFYIRYLEKNNKIYVVVGLNDSENNLFNLAIYDYHLNYIDSIGVTAQIFNLNTNGSDIVLAVTGINFSPAGHLSYGRYNTPLYEFNGYKLKLKCGVDQANSTNLCTVFSPCKKYIATILVGSSVFEKGLSLYIYDYNENCINECNCIKIREKHIVTPLNQTNTVFDIAWSPNGKYIFVPSSYLDNTSPAGLTLYTRNYNNHLL